MAITHVKLFSIPVSDQARAKAFYVDKLGFEVKEDRPIDKLKRWIEVGPKGAETSVTLVTWFPSMPAGSHEEVALETSDIEKDYELLKQKGIEFKEAIKKQVWGKYARFSDPDGNGLILQQSTEPELN